MLQPIRLHILPQILPQFGDDLRLAAEGGYDDWKQTARGQLALILLFDQFSRHIYAGHATSVAEIAFTYTPSLEHPLTGMQ